MSCPLLLRRDLASNALWAALGAGPLSAATPAWAKTDLDLYEGVIDRPSTSDMDEFSSAIFTSTGARATVSFRSPWQVSRSRGLGKVTTFETRSSIRKPGSNAFVQIVPGAEMVGTSLTQQVLDAVLQSGGQFGKQGPPEGLELLTSKTVTRAGGVKYRLTTARFSVISPNSLAVETHAVISAAVAGGDLFIFVGSCAEALWPKAAKRLVPMAESFRVSAERVEAKTTSPPSRKQDATKNSNLNATAAQTEADTLPRTTTQDARASNNISSTAAQTSPTPMDGPTQALTARPASERQELNGDAVAIPGAPSEQGAPPEESALPAASEERQASDILQGDSGGGAASRAAPAPSEATELAGGGMTARTATSARMAGGA